MSPFYPSPYFLKIYLNITLQTEKNAFKLFKWNKLCDNKVVAIIKMYMINCTVLHSVTMHNKFERKQEASYNITIL